MMLSIKKMFFSILWIYLFCLYLTIPVQAKLPGNEINAILNTIGETLSNKNTNFESLSIDVVDDKTIIVTIDTFKPESKDNFLTNSVYYIIKAFSKSTLSLEKVIYKTMLDKNTYLQGEGSLEDIKNLAANIKNPNELKGLVQINAFTFISDSYFDTLAQIVTGSSYGSLDLIPDATEDYSIKLYITGKQLITQEELETSLLKKLQSTIFTNNKYLKKAKVHYKYDTSQHYYILDKETGISNQTGNVQEKQVTAISNSLLLEMAQHIKAGNYSKALKITQIADEYLDLKLKEHKIGNIPVSIDENNRLFKIYYYYVAIAKAIGTGDYTKASLYINIVKSLIQNNLEHTTNTAFSTYQNGLLLKIKNSVELMDEVAKNNNNLLKPLKLSPIFYSEYKPKSKGYSLQDKQYVAYQNSSGNEIHFYIHTAPLPTKELKLIEKNLAKTLLQIKSTKGDTKSLTGINGSGTLTQYKKGNDSYYVISLDVSGRPFVNIIIFCHLLEDRLNVVKMLLDTLIGKSNYDV